MTFVKQLRTWDEIPDDDSDAFHWLDLKTAEAADLIERQAAQIEMMRVALQSAEWNSLDLPQFVVTQIVEALSTTPDQALEQFAAKVREQCAKSCEMKAEMVWCDSAACQACATTIRAITELPK